MPPQNFRFKWATFMMALTAVFACLSLSSCKDKNDDPSDEASIIGSWRVDWDIDNYDIYIFNEDGTFQAIGVEDGYSGYDEGTYIYTGYSITFIFDEDDDYGESTMRVISLTKNELILSGDGETIHFYRVK